MKKVFLLMLVFSLLIAGLPALAQDDDEAGDEEVLELEPWTCPEGFEGQTLRVFNWSTYFAEDTIPNFEELCGVTVEYNEYASNEEMLTIIRQGSVQYDIVVPSGDTVEIMITEELAHPLNYGNIPNAVNILPAFADPPYDPGNVYSVPYQWGTVGIGYDQTFVGEPILSWEDFFNYEGPVAWLGDQRAMLGVALMLLGHDPNTTDADEIEEAKNYLLEHGDNVDAIAADDGQAMLERGDVDAVVEYSGDIFQIMFECECDDFVYVIPAEGTTVWADNLMIPANAANPELAEVFIDYILDPQVGADLSNYIAYGSPNQASIELGLIDEALLADPGIYPDEEIMLNLFWVRSVGEAEQLYAEAWNELRVELAE